jgi:high-affinity iron transporter
MSLNSFLERCALCAILLSSSLIVRPALAQDQNEVARRIADIASIAVAEYAEGVVDGRIVRPEEYGEARTFLEEARVSAEGLAEATGIVPHLDAMQRGVADLVAVAHLRTLLAELRSALEAAVGVPLDPLPDSPPSLARGQTVYRQHCAQCHGHSGGGDGALAAPMDPPPANLTHDALAATSPVDFFRKINVGVAGTAMPGFVGQLSLFDRWSAALYASLLRHYDVDRDSGAVLMLERCRDCVLLMSDFALTAMASDDSLATLLGARLRGGDPSRAAIAYARAAAAEEELGGDRSLAAVRAVREARRLAQEAERLARAGQAEAAGRRALDGYLAFEEIESAVRARDAGAATAVERAFADYRGVIGAGRVAKVESARRDVEGSLDRALSVMTANAVSPVLFGQSLVIMLREGLEAILIIGALTAVLTKAGASERKRELGWGVLAALALSVLTAVAFGTLFHVSAASQEMLEGITMLLAAGVLFWVSYWLVSKIELRKWMAFVRGQVGSALARGSGWALAAVAFLAVYREGFETVLFYAALFSSAGGAPGTVGAVAAGMIVGVVCLGAVYVAMQRFGVRIPLKPFFAVTSGLLYLMAFSFAGQGVAELQEAGVISITPLDWLPAVPFLGIFPTIQTALSQLFLALALVGGLAWVFWLEPKVSEGQPA